MPKYILQKGILKSNIKSQKTSLIFYKKYLLWQNCPQKANFKLP